jgi:hypothetical protein
MSLSNNLWVRWQSRTPEPITQVATVQSIDLTAEQSLVQLPGGALQRVTGTSVGVGQKAFVRDGAIEGPAPALEGVDIVI